MAVNNLHFVSELLMLNRNQSQFQKKIFLQWHQVIVFFGKIIARCFKEGN